MRQRDNPLLEHELPEWRGKYFPYSRLKNQLKAAVGAPESPGRSIRLSWGQGAGSRATALEQWEQDMETEAVLLSERLNIGLASLRAQLAELSQLSANVGLHASARTNGTVARNQSYMIEPARLTSTTEMTAAAEMTAAPETAAAPRPNAVAATALTGASMMLERDAIQELRVLEGLCRVSQSAKKFHGFAELNHAAIFKLTKRRDQELGTTHGVLVQLPKLVQLSGVDDTQRFDDLQREIRRAFMRSPACEGLEASPQVAQLAAGLAKNPNNYGERALSFFLGSAVTLIIAILIILRLPGLDEKTIDTAYFMSNFLIFRIIMSVILIFWGMGFVERVCLGWGVNHMFVLDVDPRMTVGHQYFFSVAMILSALLIATFGAYVLDYKYMLMTPMPHSDESAKRSSLHYMFYPVGLLIVTFCFVLLPSHSCRNRNKRAVTKSILRTLAAPFFAVTFCDNLAGDVLTSLVKPLQDLPAAYCYLVGSHPQTHEQMKTFQEEGNLCPSLPEQLAMPLIAGLPLWWRMLQCSRRYYGDGHFKHMLNFGKYTASITVVICGAALGAGHPIVIILSIFSTVYSSTWDVYCDWGIGFDEMKVISNMSRRGAISADPLTADSEATLMELQEPIKVATKQRGRPLLFPKYIYPMVIVFDVMGRCSWVLSLLPIIDLTGDIPLREVFRFLMTAVEIMRRSIWAVIRIEHEQVSNASNYRALMWVPTRMTIDPEENKLLHGHRD